MAVGSPGNQYTGKLDPLPGVTGPNPLTTYKISHKQSTTWQKLARRNKKCTDTEGGGDQYYPSVLAQNVPANAGRTILG